MALDIDTVYRDNVIKGDIHSGANDPDKADIRALLKSLFGAASSPAVVKNTRAALDLITPVSENYGGRVLNDPDPSNNGEYYRSGGGWVRGRGFPDTFALLIDVGGTANAITASVGPGVDPGNILCVLLPNPPGTNSAAAVTLAIEGEVYQIKAASGANLAIGDIVDGVGTLFFKVGAEWRQLFSSTTGATFDHQGPYSGVIAYTEGQVVTGSDDAWYQLKVASASDDDPVTSVTGNWLKIFDGSGLSDGSVTNAKVAPNAAIDWSKLARGVISMVRARVVDAVEGDPTTDYEAGDTVDGVTLVAGDVVLRATSGGDPADGVWVVPTTGAASRLNLFSEFNDFPGVQFSVEDGGNYGATTWRCISVRSGSALLGTDDLEFTRIVASTTIPGVVDLATFMDARYGVGGWSQRGDTPNAGTDIGPAIDDALDHIAAVYGSLSGSFRHGGTVLIPPGIWRMATPPAAAKLLGNTIKGAGPYASSQIVYDASSGTMFDFNATGAAYPGSGGGLEDLNLFIEDGAGSTTAICIRLFGDSSRMPDSTRFRNLNITRKGATGSWQTGITANGTNRTTVQGIRTVEFEHINIFCCSSAGMSLLNVVQCSLDQIGLFVPAAAGGDRLTISGLGASNTNSINVTMNNITGGDLQTVNCSQIFGYGCFFSSHTSNSTWTNSRIEGAISSVVGTPGTKATLVNVA